MSNCEKDESNPEAQKAEIELQPEGGAVSASERARGRAVAADLRLRDFGEHG